MSGVNGTSSAPVWVLGFGRSGTSLTMRLLHLLGVEIGPKEDLVAPGEADNPRGYWEPRWMVELNDEILAKLGTVWWRPLPAELGWERSPDFDELRDRARRLLKERLDAAPIWGWWWEHRTSTSLRLAEAAQTTTALQEELRSTRGSQQFTVRVLEVIA